MTEAKLAVQLYTLRNAGLTFDETLSAVADAGYDGVETVGSHARTAAELRAALARHGLEGCSTHVPLEALLNEFDATIDFYGEAGIETLVVPFLKAADRPHDATGWSVLGERLGGLAERLAERGFALLYHNHDFEFEGMDGDIALAHLFRDAAPLGLELDLGWVVRAGADPHALLSRYSGRVLRVHVKDVAAGGDAEVAFSGEGDTATGRSSEGGWADVGHGTIRWPPLLDAARSAGAHWWVVEHDEPRDGVASVRRSGAYLRKRLAGT